MNKRSLFLGTEMGLERFVRRFSPFVLVFDCIAFLSLAYRGWGTWNWAVVIALLIAASTAAFALIVPNRTSR